LAGIITELTRGAIQKSNEHPGLRQWGYSVAFT
jgi:hypothetical protein